jgi:small subunit ribosomal protein S1
VHISDLSWTRKLKHPSEMVKVDDKLEVAVLELDLENRRISLGHKQVEENPWDTFETVFPIGSLHKGTITSKAEKGFTVELPYGIEGFANTKQAALADGNTPNVGDSLDFKVVEFNKDDRRILVSHAATYQVEAPEKKAAAPKKTAKKEAVAEAGAGVTITNETARTSLSDNEALSALREKLSGN